MVTFSSARRHSAIWSNMASIVISTWLSGKPVLRATVSIIWERVMYQYPPGTACYIQSFPLRAGPCRKLIKVTYFCKIYVAEYNKRSVSNRYSAHETGLPAHEGLFFLIQRCNVHQRHIFQAVLAAQAIHQSIGGIHCRNAGDTQFDGLAAQPHRVTPGVAALGAGGEDIVHQTALEQVNDVGSLARHIPHLVAGHHVLVQPGAGAGGAVQLVAHALELPSDVHKFGLVAVLHGEDAAA